jgi:ABC-type oligopeptide transport system ATPase subunit
LLANIQERTQISILIITHNLSVVRHISDRMIVMLRGAFVEEGETERIFAAPHHDYTKRLLAATQHVEPSSEFPYAT